MRRALSRNDSDAADGWGLAYWRANGLRPLATPECLHRTAIPENERLHRLTKRTPDLKLESASGTFLFGRL